MEAGIAVVNCGSTSLKFAVYATGNSSVHLLYRGMIDSMQTDPHLVVKDKDGKPLSAHEWARVTLSITAKRSHLRSSGVRNICRW
jgi:acetate kinase